MPFYEVVCRCGHVGKYKYVLKSFPICAKTRTEAAEKARLIPRVKHNSKEAIESVIEVDEQRYREIRHMNDNDPYLHCHNKKEQNAICDLQILRKKISFHKKTHRKDSLKKKDIRLKAYKIKYPTKIYEYSIEDFTA